MDGGAVGRPFRDRRGSSRAQDWPGETEPGDGQREHGLVQGRRLAICNATADKTVQDLGRTALYTGPTTICPFRERLEYWNSVSEERCMFIFRTLPFGATILFAVLVVSNTAPVCEARVTVPLTEQWVRSADGYTSVLVTPAVTRWANCGNTPRGSQTEGLSRAERMRLCPTAVVFRNRSGRPEPIARFSLANSEMPRRTLLSQNGEFLVTVGSTWRSGYNVVVGICQADGTPIRELRLEDLLLEQDIERQREEPPLHRVFRP